MYVNIFWLFVYTKVQELSSIQTAEFALFKGSWINHNDEAFKCGSYYKGLAKRTDADVVIPYERTKRGCGVITNEPILVTDEGIGYHSCMCHPDFQHPLFGELILMSEAYKRGNLPYPGSFTEQPSKIIEYFALLDSHQAELELERQQKQQEEAKREQAKTKQRRR